MKRQPSEIPASLKTIDVKAVLRKRGVYLRQRQNQELKRAAMPLAKRVIQNKKRKSASQPRRHAQFTNDEVMSYWEKQIHIVEVLEKKFDLKLEQFVQKMVDGFLSGIETEITTKQVKKAVKGYFDDNEADLLVQAQVDFTPLLTDQAVLAGQEAFKLVGSKDIYTPFKLRETIAQNVAKFTQSMIDTDRQRLIDMLTNGIKDGKSIPEIRRMIQDDFDTKAQAQRVSRTEVLRASNQATLDAYEQSGLVEGKQWLTAGAVDECQAYDGQIESLSGSFYSDSSDFADGDPPLHPNCRCVLLPVLIS